MSYEDITEEKSRELMYQKQPESMEDAHRAKSFKTAFLRRMKATISVHR